MESQICTYCEQPAGFLTSLRVYRRQRSFFRCTDCGLIFADRRSYLSFEEERERYLTHRNDAKFPANRERNESMVCQVRQWATGNRILDYGCGPGAPLAPFLAKQGFEVFNFDPHFYPQAPETNAPYDGIFCSETAEHFVSPRKEFSRMNLLLRPGGIVWVMTTLTDGLLDFSQWNYARDITHLSFYCKKTFERINDGLGWQSLAVGVFRKTLS